MPNITVDGNGISVDFMPKNTKGLTSGDISDLIVIRENNAKIIAEAIDSAKARALEMIGQAAEGYAQRLCPVATGRLRNSITHIQDDDSAYIGTNVEYGPYVELGTSKKDAHPFLKPAAQDHADQYRRILKSQLGG